MLFSPDRHEPVCTTAWSESQAREAIARIVHNTQESFSPRRYWPTHPMDTAKDGPQYMLYWGACGVLWALRYLEKQGAVSLERDYASYVAPLVARNQTSMGQAKAETFSSYMMGDTSIQMLQYWHQPIEATADELARLVEQTMDHPARELMWGAPGTLLAALRMHQLTGQARWAALYQSTARKLWTQLEWSQEHSCHYWTQSLYGQQSNYLDAVHGFVATAVPLIQGRHLLAADAWGAWQRCIANTVRKTAEWEDGLVNWRARLSSTIGAPKLVQFCHGAPGFVICLADFPDASLDDVLIAGGETIWQAGPLRKGSNLCHGTGGNGYAFLKLYRRFNDVKWLERARAFAMHGIAQTEADLVQYGRLRYSLWTGDLGFAIYLWDCIQGTDRFPTLDVFFVD